MFLLAALVVDPAQNLEKKVVMYAHTANRSIVIM